MTNNVPSHIQRLKDEFEFRSARNGHYSLRAFARDLGLSPASLSGLMNLKKGLSETNAQKIAARLGLSKSETEAFLVSVAATHARSPVRRRGALEKIQSKSLREKRQKKIELDTFSQIQSWYSLSLLELMELDTCTHKPEWFAAKLQLNTHVIKNALERLITVGLIEFRDGKYRATTEESVTDEDIPSLEIKNFHAEMLKKSEEALFSHAVSNREFINLTFAFPTAEMEEAKKMIRDFQNQFAERFYHQTKKKKNSVFQLSMQFFRIDKEK